MRIFGFGLATLARATGLAALVALGAPAVASAQSAIIYGSLGNFDISNDTGKVCHGFEIDIDGLQPSLCPHTGTPVAGGLGYEEVMYLLDLADCMVTGAIARHESRGAHSRTDFPDRDDENWMKHTLAYLDDGEIRLDYSPVTMTKYEPQVRSY